MACWAWRTRSVPGCPRRWPSAIARGIRVLMITGDYPTTARSIAEQVGLKPLDDIITGQELDRMSDAELQRRIRKTSIFARAVPEQKLRIVNALKANGEVVAMTGDGVNDAPGPQSGPHRHRHGGTGHRRGP